MPRTLKRRSEAISRDQEEDESSSASSEAPPRRSTQKSTQRQTQRRRSSPPSEAATPLNGSDNEAGGDSQTTTKILVKKLVRYALSCEYARQTIKRTEINTKILKGDDTNAKARGNFKAVFLGAQQTLRNVFGMEMVDLPAREKTGMQERRKAVSQKMAASQKAQSTQKGKDKDADDGETQGKSQRAKDPLLSATSWILVSCLPEAYRAREELLVTGRAPDSKTEATYVALCHVIVSLLYIHTPSGSNATKDKRDTQAQSQNGGGGQQDDSTEPLNENKLVRYLSRLDIKEYTPMGRDGATTLDKTLARMMKEGYIDKRKDNSSGEEIVEWVVGPRGKREIGRQGVAGFVRGVYGFGVDGTGHGLPMPGGDEVGEGGNADGEEQPRQRVKMEKDELERRLERTLGNVVASKIDKQQQVNGIPDEEEQEERPEASHTRAAQNNQERRATRRSGRRRGADDDDDDDD